MVPAKINPPALSWQKIFAILLGLAGSAVVLSLPIPLWLRGWLWVIPALLSVGIAWGQIGKRPVPIVLVDLIRYLARRKHMIWARRTSSLRYGVVVPSTTRFVPPVLVGVVVTITAATWWLYRRPVVHERSVVFANTASLLSSPAGFCSPMSTPSGFSAAPVPVEPSPEPTPTPFLPSYVVELQGSVYLWMRTQGVCLVQISTSQASFVAPVDGEAKVLLVPLLMPVDRVSVRPCSTGTAMEAIPFRPWHVEYAQTWFIPACRLPGHLWIRTDSLSELVILDSQGEIVSRKMIQGVFVSPYSECLMYKIEAANPIAVEIQVRD